MPAYAGIFILASPSEVPAHITRGIRRVSPAGETAACRR